MHSTSTTRRRLTALAAAGVLLALPAFATAAYAADDPCTPKDAWTETIPAKGEPTIVVDNPDYLPGKAAEYTTVRHKAVTEMRTTYQRYSWVGGGNVNPNETGSTPATHPGDWQANTTDRTGHENDPIGEVFNPSGNENSSAWFFWTSETKKVVVTPAWKEQVLLYPAIPPQGEPTMTVDNPDYVPASEIKHEAVLCGAVAGADEAKLAETGLDVRTASLVAGVVLLLGAGLAYAARRRLMASEEL
ncbi:MAG: hypothetical protein FWD18_06180 [Micrococcales bacterium]|nr:hypothetical protein [Micrococcales bacterium]